MGVQVKFKDIEISVMWGEMSSILNCRQLGRYNDKSYIVCGGRMGHIVMSIT